jgi:hypothetical protein
VGADAQAATLNVNSNNASNGRVVINLQLPFGQKFPAGIRQLLILTFNVPTSSTLNSTTISFANGAVVDEQANNLPAPLRRPSSRSIRNSPIRRRY